MREFTEAEVARIFDEALTLPREGRMQFIDRACGGRDALRREVASLLTAHDGAGHFLNQSVLQEQPGITQFADPLLGRSIGPYVVERRIGGGGMGDVFLGRRDDQTFDLLVAIKVIRRGILGEETIRRFALERQLLANLTHPNIARLLDGGTTEDGQPYLVMEYIQGERLDHWCDARCLSIDARIDLFLQICEAVREAHRHLVVHRDLKPGNVLVTDEGIVKLLDFGLARWVSPRAHPTGDATQTIERRLTPAYASPEQIRGESVTTTSDVYSLGVNLYELLTGRSPYTVSTKDSRRLEKAICDDEPTRPSETVTRPGRVVDEICRRRSTDSSRLCRRLKGDLGTIIMTALRKEPERRYASVEQLAEDIRNERRSLPILARPDTFGYRAQRFVQRNRLAVVGAVAMLLVLIGSTVVSFNFALREAAAREREREQRLAAQLERDRAVEAERVAEQRADELELVSDFQASQFADIDLEMMGLRLRDQLIVERLNALRLHDTDEISEESARQMLDQALAGMNFTNMARASLEQNVFQRGLHAIDEQFAAQPGIRALLLQRIAGTMHSLGMADSAEEPLQQAIALKRELYGDQDIRTLEAISRLGSLRMLQSRFTAAETAAREAWIGMRRSIGTDDPRTLVVATVVAAAIRSQGDRDGAEAILTDALESARASLGDEHHTSLYLMNQLGYLHLLQGRVDVAEPLIRHVIDSYQRAGEETHGEAMRALGYLSLVLLRQGRSDEALDKSRQLLALRRVERGDDHISTILAASDLGRQLIALQQYEEAELLLHNTIERSQRILGEDHKVTMSALTGLGFIYLRQRRNAEAEKLYRRAVRIGQSVSGRSHPDTHSAVYNLATILNREGKNEECLEIMHESIERQRRELDPTNPRLLRCLRTLARCLRDLDNPAEAEAFFREAYEGYDAFYGPMHLQTMISLNDYCEVLLIQNKLAGAAAFLPALLEVRRRIRGPLHPQTIRAEFQLITSLNQLERFDEAYDQVREVLAVITAENHRDDPRRAEAKRLLTETLFGLNRFEEAATTGQAAYAMLARAPEETPLRSADLAALLARIYDAWQRADPEQRHHDQVEFWRRQSILDSENEPANPSVPPNRTDQSNPVSRILFRPWFSPDDTLRLR